MKLLAINSSPRKGNSDFMLDTLLNSAKENNAEVCEIKLREAKINFCNGGDNCCPKTSKCSIPDNMPEIYTKLEEADIVILASPCYFFNVTARMKNFMDRCNPYFFSKKLKGKKFFLISVGGHEPSLKGSIRAMNNFLKGIGGKFIGSYSAVADKAGEIKKNTKVIKELKDIGKRLS